MAVRISSGILKGMHVNTPVGQDTRPTASKVRSSVMNACADRIEGGKVLDCFAGSGAIGIEALSWGAREVCFVENSKPAIRAIRKNFQELQRRSKADSKNRHGSYELLEMDFMESLRLLAAKEKFDLIWMDPPYKFLLEVVYIEEFWNLIKDCLENSGAIVIESCGEGAQLLEAVSLQLPWEVRRQKKYGLSYVTILD